MDFGSVSRERTRSKAKQCLSRSLTRSASSEAFLRNEGRTGGGPAGLAWRHGEDDLGRGAPFTFLDGVEAAISAAQERAGDRIVDLSGGG